VETRSAVAIPSSKYDDFLFAVIWEEPNGTQLSVLSALTRADIDPWEEAARLSAMTEPIAKSRLISVLSRATENSWTPPQQAAIASRIVRRLPSTYDKDGSASAQLSEVNGRMLVFLVFWWSFAIAVAAYSSYRQRAHTADGISAPYSSATVPSREVSAGAETRIPTD
jgi:hypothetical protein